MSGSPFEPSIESISARAQELTDPLVRGAYLDRACAGDPAMRHTVERLLEAHDLAERLREPSGADELDPDATADVTSGVPGAVAVNHPAPGAVHEGSGSRIGPYKLLQEIGRGGMGAVYMAEQERPVRRLVALKIIKPGMDSAEVVARFEAERQALALMDHPNIARVFEAGTTELGRPYFVMELVHGIPITDYCDRNQLTPSCGSSYLSPSTKRSSTRIRRGSSTATSSRRTFWSPFRTANPSRRSSTSASRRRLTSG